MVFFSEFYELDVDAFSSAQFSSFTTLHRGYMTLNVEEGGSEKYLENLFTLLM